MKFLKDEEFDLLKAKANNYDQVVASVVEANDGISAADVTPEVILAAITNEAVADSATVSNLNDQVSNLTTERDNLKSANETLTEDLATANSTIEDLKAENKELAELPGAESVSGKKGKKENSTSETDDLLAFAQANKGNTVAIAAKMQELGYV